MLDLTAFENTEIMHKNSKMRILMVGLIWLCMTLSQCIKHISLSND